MLLLALGGLLIWTLSDVLLLIFVMDKLRAYGEALKDLDVADRQKASRWLNNRAQNSHLS